jgi:para-nitrobenzyl esterase
LQSPLHSTHGLDLPFLLGTWPDWHDAPMLHGVSSRNVLESLRDEMKYLWASFAQGETKGLGDFTISGDKAFEHIVSRGMNT